MRILLAVLLAVVAHRAALAEPPPLEAYAAMPGVEIAALSPSGRRTAFIVNNSDGRSLIVIDDETGPLARSTVGELRVRDVTWIGENRVLVKITEQLDIGPYFRSPAATVDHAFVLDVETNEAFGILQNGPEGNGIWGDFGIRRRNGHWYGFFGGITLAMTKEHGAYFFEKGHPDLYRVDLETNLTWMVARGPKNENRARHWAVAPDGEVAATYDYSNDDGAWRIRAGKRGDVLAEGVDLFDNVYLSGPGRRPGTVIYTYRQLSGGDVVIEQPTDGGPGEQLWRAEAVLGRISEQRSGLLMGYVRDGDQPEVVLFDPERQATWEATLDAFPGRNIDLMSWNDAFDKLIVRTDGGDDSGTWWAVDAVAGTADEIGRERADIAPEHVASVRMITYRARDGLPIDGVLTLPPGMEEARDLPLVMFPHGGPTSRNYPVFDWWAQAFATRGYAVFQPNFRGSTGYGSAFRDAGDGEWGDKMQTDLVDGVRELSRRGIIDPERVCIMGASYGGYAALAGVTMVRDVYRCAVAINGLSDLHAFVLDVRDDEGKTGPLTRTWLARFGDEIDLDAISPAKHAERVDAPVLLIHGRDDNVAPFDQSRRMARALEDAGKPFEFVTLENGDHWLTTAEMRLETLRAAEAFIRAHNPPNAESGL